MYIFTVWGMYFYYVKCIFIMRYAYFYNYADIAYAAGGHDKRINLQWPQIAYKAAVTTDCV